MFNNILRYLKTKQRQKKHKYYGHCYLPNYNTRAPFEEGDSNLYNEFGEKLEIFFIRDKHYRTHPYRDSRYFMWDRYNFSHKTHFYSHESMLETQGMPDRKYGFLTETPAIVPKSYKLFDKFKGLEKDFDLIFTYSEDILNKIDNARFVPFGATLYNGTMAPSDIYKTKSKNVSILSSDKLMCKLHKFRYDLAWKCKKENLADTFGTFDKGSLVTIDDTLRNYRFSICIENFIEPYLFTERLICALANQTIPIYLGATKVDEFFNPDGIIKITTKSDIEKILKQCTKEEYENRLNAVLDNYKRVQNYTKPFDYLYKNYLEQK